MTPDIQFFADLTVALSAAMVGGWLANRAGMNAIVGYIVAGVAIGPFTPGYVANGETIANLAELGLIFLLFSIGLGFSFSDLVAAGARAILAGFGVMVALAGIFWAGATALGFPHPVTLALIAVVSSTAIAVSLLRESALDGNRVGQIALALLVSQDLAAVALLVVVSAPTASLSALGIAIPLAKAVGFVVVALV
ncbi:MAG: cation:proton antiporter, partial [Vulcanimicrobiaceae bacterium]